MLTFLLFLVLDFHSSAMRSMYVDDFSSILGDIAAENALLSYSQSNGIETLLLYELHIVNATYPLADYATNSILADFISKAKTNYGILKVGAVGENGDFFMNVIQAYNETRSSPNEKFDIYNLEFEFWVASSTNPGAYYCDTYLTPNGLPCTNDGAFQFFFTQVQTMNDLSDLSFHPITTEAYVGWPTLSQAATIGSLVDRLHLHAYVSDPNNAYGYASDRIANFGATNDGLEVSVIFSSESTFMQNWLATNSMTAAETIFYNDWQNASISWVNNIDLVGFTYFAYSFNSNIALATDALSLNDQVTVFPNPVHNLLTINYSENVERIRMYDNLGLLMLETNDTTIDLRGFANGIYSLQIFTNEGKTVKKLVKE